MKSLMSLLLLTLVLSLGFNTVSYADMPDKKDWQKARDKSLNGMGMGKALKQWATDCTDPKKFKTYAEFTTAEETILNLYQVTLNVSEKASKLKKKKAKEKAETFLDTVKSEITDYQKEIKKSVKNRQKELKEQVKVVVKAIKKATSTLEGYEEDIVSAVSDINVIVKAMDGKALSVETLEKHHKSLLKLETTLRDIPKNSEETLDILRNLKTISTFRTQGGKRTAESYGLGAKKDIQAANDLFSDVSELFVEIEKIGRNIKVSALEQESTVKVYIAKADKDVSEADTEIVRLEALEKQVQQQVEATGIIIGKNSEYLVKMSKASEIDKKKSKVGILAQINVAKSKMIAANKSLEILEKIALQVDDIPKNVEKNPAVLEVQLRVIKQIPELGGKIQEWVDKTTKNLALWDEAAILALDP